MSDWTLEPISLMSGEIVALKYKGQTPTPTDLKRLIDLESRLHAAENESAERLRKVMLDAVEIHRFKQALSELMQYMGQTCDENENINGVSIEETHTTSMRFHAAWKEAADLLDETK